MHFLLRFSLAAILGTFSGCSLLVDFSECEDNSDCPSGVCNDSICSTAGCETHDDCGGGDVCIGQVCVDLDEEQCTLPFEDDIQDVPVHHVGIVMPLTGRNGQKGDATSKGAAVAFNQINLTATGINGTRLSAVRCDSKNNATDAVSVATYLVEELGLRSIIGSISSDETLEIATKVTIDNDVFMISPASTSPQISSLSDNDLVWRTIGSDAVQAPALAKLVDAGGYNNIVIFSAKTAYGQGFFDAFSASGIVGPDRFQLVSYDLDASGDLDTESFVDDASRIFVEEGIVPDLIVVFGSVESQQLIFSIETTYFDAIATADRPDWILTEAARDTGLLDAKFDDVKDRISGTLLRLNDSSAYDNFATRLASEHQLDAKEHPFADKAYDAAFMLALAHGTTDSPYTATGSALAEAFQNLSDGASFTPGDEFAGAVSSLKSGGIDFTGASGSVDFDENGDVPSDIVSWTIVDDAFVDGSVID